MADANQSADAPAREELRLEALSDLDALVDLTKQLRSDLDAYLVDVAKTRRTLSEGGRASDMPTLFDVAAVRASLSDRLNAIERARAAARRSLWRLQIDEGLTIAEVARVWGFSRQLVSRSLAAGATRRSE